MSIGSYNSIGCKFNLHGGYRSKDGFLNRSEPSIAWLREQIIPRVNEILYFGVVDKTLSIKFTIEGWGAVLRQGHGQKMHVHPGSMYAGVYYVTAPEGIGQPGNSEGCLQLYEPRNGATMAQVARGISLYGESVEVCPTHTGGILFIFPSWLPHEVRPMTENFTGPRIAISFNVLYSN